MTNPTGSNSATTSFAEVCSNVASTITQYFTPTVSAEAKPADSEEAEEEAEEDDEDPEDPAPAIREECAESKCSKYKRHFDHCQERVLGGKGDKGEDCVEELFHLMHCVDECATPKVFSKLV